jgi:hypothetical protein
MNEEFNFKCICNLTTRVMELPKGALYTKSRKRPLQVARASASYIARMEENIHHNTIGKVLNRDRSMIYHYENTHKKYFANCSLYRETFNKIYKAYMDVDESKEMFLNAKTMKQYLLNRGVSEVAKPNVILEIKSGQVTCKIKTTYFDYLNQFEKVKFALENYHYSIKII